MGTKDKDLIPQEDKSLLTGWPRLNDLLKTVGLPKGQLAVFSGRRSNPPPPPPENKKKS